MTEKSFPGAITPFGTKSTATTPPSTQNPPRAYLASRGTQLRTTPMTTTNQSTNSTQRLSASRGRSTGSIFMNITARTCANCAAFNPVRAIDEPRCFNLVSFTVSPDSDPDPGPADSCNAHQTHQEDADQTADIEANRDAIWDSITATVAARELLDKLRKGGNP